VAIRGVPAGDGPERLWRFEERAEASPANRED